MSAEHQRAERGSGPQPRASRKKQRPLKARQRIKKEQTTLPGLLLTHSMGPGSKCFWPLLTPSKGPAPALDPLVTGRGGSCELMVGCLARARSEELAVNFEEMEDVRWVGHAGEGRG